MVLPTRCAALALSVFLVACNDSGGGGGGTNGPSTTGCIDGPEAPSEVTVALGSSTSFVVTVEPGQQLFVEPMPLPPGMSLNLANGLVEFVPQLEQAGQTLEMMWTAVTAQGASGCSSTNITVEAASMGGDTNLQGTVLASETGAPLVGVEVSLPGTSISTTTGSDGRFLLGPIPAGSLVVDIHGAGAGHYAFVAEDLELLLGHVLYPGQVNVVDRPIFLPNLGAVAGTVSMSGPTKLRSPLMPEIELEIAANSAQLANGDPFEGDMFIPIVTPETTPAALPETLNAGLVVAFQPAGVFFSEPAQLTLPNTDNLPAGSRVNLWSVNPETGQFEIAGQGQVNGAGTLITTIEGGVRAASWHFVAPEPGDLTADSGDDGKDPADGHGGDPEDTAGGPAPGAGDEGGDPPGPGGNTCSGGGGGQSGPRMRGLRSDPQIGSWVDVNSGNLTIEHRTAPFVSMNRERSLRFVYNAKSAYPAPIVTSDIITSGAVGLIVPPVMSTTLTVGGVNQGVTTFTEGLDGTSRHAVQFDSRDVPSGFHPYNLRISHHFDESTVARDIPGHMLVNNQSQSPFGAGWTLDGLQRLHFTNGVKEVLVTEGDGGAVAMVPREAAPSGVTVELAIVLDGAEDSGASAVDFAQWREALRFLMVLEDVVPRDGTLAVTVLQVGDAGGGSGARVEIPRTLISSQAAASQLAADIHAMTRLGGNADLGAGLDLAQQELSGTEQLAHQAVWLVTSRQLSSRAAIEASNAAVAGGVDEVTVFAEDPNFASTANLEFLGRLVKDGRLIRIRLNNPPMPQFDVQMRYLVRGAPLGESSHLRRNADGSFTRYMRRGARFDFAASGRLDVAVDRNGNETRYIYESDLLVRVEEPLGKSTRLRYDNGLLRETEDPVGRVTRFRHDAQGRLLSITDPDGSERRFEYEEPGAGSDVPNGALIKRQFDKRGNQASEYEWSPFGRLTGVVKADSARYEVEAAETAALRENPASTSLTSPGFPFDAEALEAELIDGRGQSTFYKFDNFGKPTYVRDPLGREVSIERTEDGYMSITNLPGRANIRATHNRFGEIELWETWGFGAANRQDRRFTYDENGFMLSYRSPAEGVWDYLRDSSGNVRMLTEPGGVVTRLSYDEGGQGAPGAAGLLTRVQRAFGLPEVETSELFYDSSGGNLRRVEDAAGRITEFVRNGAGMVEEVRQLGLGGQQTPLVTSYAYDVMGRVLSITDPDGSVTELDYDVQGNLTHVRDAKSPSGVTMFDYDAMNRVRERTDALGYPETFTYDLNGALRTHTDREGHVFTYFYDDAGRLTRKEFPGATGALGNEYLTWSYEDGDGDPLNDQDHVTLIERVQPGEGISRISMEWEDDHKVLERESTEGSTWQPSIEVRVPHVAFQNQRDQIGVFEGGNAITNAHYEYDRHSRVTELNQDEGGDAQLRFVYDELGRMEERQVRDSAAGPWLRSVHEFFTGGDVCSVAAEWRSGMGASWESVSSFDYLYDVYGRRSQRSSTQQAFGGVTHVEAFGYDDVSRLTDVVANTVQDEAFSYDNVGNRLTVLGGASTWQYNAANQLLDDGAFTYEYDRNGNRILKRDKLAMEETVYTWTPENMLESITQSDGSSVMYRYDGLARRVYKEMRDAQGVVTEIHRFVYDREDIVLLDIERPGGSDSRVAFLHGPGTDHPCIQIVDGEVEAFVLDALGSVTDQMDLSSGVVTQAYRHSSFGLEEQVLDPMRSSEWGTYGFTARERDQESGLMGYRFRMYDPSVGRFASEDPIGFLGGDVNLFGYVGGRPVEATDPSGLFAPAFAATIAGGVAGAYVDQLGTALFPCSPFAVGLASSLANALVVGAVGAGAVAAGATIGVSAGAAIAGGVVGAGLIYGYNALLDL